MLLPRLESGSARDIILARMTGGLETIDTHRVDPRTLCRQSMTDRRAFVDDLDASGLEALHQLCRAAPRCLDNLDTTFDDGGRVIVVRGGDVVGRMVRLTPNGKAVRVWQRAIS